MDISATHGRTAAAVPPVGEPTETDNPAAGDRFRREAAAETTSARTPTGGTASA